jgi:hypothetical protein
MKLYSCIKTLLQSTALSPDSLEPPKAFAHEKKRERNEYSGVSEEPTKVKEMKQGSVALLQIPFFHSTYLSSQHQARIADDKLTCMQGFRILG